MSQFFVQIVPTVATATVGTRFQRLGKKTRRRYNLYVSRRNCQGRVRRFRAFSKDFRPKNSKRRSYCARLSALSTAAVEKVDVRRPEILERVDFSVERFDFNEDNAPRCVGDVRSRFFPFILMESFSRRIPSSVRRQRRRRQTLPIFPVATSTT